MCPPVIDFLKKEGYINLKQLFLSSSYTDDNEGLRQVLSQKDDVKLRLEATDETA